MTPDSTAGRRAVAAFLREMATRVEDEEIFGMELSLDTPIVRDDEWHEEHPDDAVTRMCHSEAGQLVLTWAGGWPKRRPASHFKP